MAESVFEGRCEETNGRRQRIDVDGFQKNRSSGRLDIGSASAGEMDQDTLKKLSACLAEHSICMSHHTLFSSPSYHLISGAIHTATDVGVGAQSSVTVVHTRRNYDLPVWYWATRCAGSQARLSRSQSGVCWVCWVCHAWIPPPGPLPTALFR